MENFIKKSILFLLVFMLIFRPEFVFIPFGINRFFGVIGLLVFYYDKQTRHQISNITSVSFKPFFKLLIPPLLISFFSLLINGTSDLYFPRYVLSMFLAFYAAYLIAWGFFRVYKDVAYEKMVKYMLLGGVVYTITALLCFLDPALLDFANSIQRIDEIAEKSIDRTEGTRLIGIGANFFTSSIVNGTIIILLGAYMAVRKNTVKEKVILALAFIIISILGMMMARTVLIAVAIGILWLTFSFVKTTKDFFQTTIAACLLYAVIVVAVPLFFKEFAEEMDILTSFGFEMFKNKSEGGNFESASMIRLYEMWETVPDSLHSWIIGDGLWDWKGGYYKSVDLGYLRHIWYFGIIGTIFVFRYYFFSIKYIFIGKRLFAPRHKLLAISLFVFVLIANAKGPCDLFLYIIPFYFCKSNYNKILYRKI